MSQSVSNTSTLPLVTALLCLVTPAQLRSAQLSPAQSDETREVREMFTGAESEHD